MCGLMCEAQEEHSGSERLLSSAIEGYRSNLFSVFSSSKYRTFFSTDTCGDSMAGPLTAEALRAELRALLDMRDESLITQEDFAKLKEAARL